MGPTASGKTALASRIVDALGCGIVSVDSALVYRGLDIGTAKPGADVLATAPHRLVDIIEPHERYSAARFREDALAAMAEITASGRVPLLVGGTMLYFRALLGGLSGLPPADPAVRASIGARAERDGWPALHRSLARVDPDAAARIHPNDAQRIQRALEVWELTGTPISGLQSGIQAPPPYRVYKLAVAPADRGVLHGRIEARLQRMLTEGFLDEVRRLRDRGDLDPGMPSMRAVGYRQLWAHLDGRYGYEEAVRRAVHATRQLAKRQLTWLRRERDVEWLDSDAPGWVDRGVGWACDKIESCLMD